jgi:predicted DNA-binding transcriptional regulator YafY
MASRLDRVLRIVILLQTGVPYNAHQLALETGVHRRTIFRDIASLRNLGLPVQFDSETARYFLVQDSMIGGAQAITTDELTELLLAANLALCTGDVVRRATEKLALRLPPERRKRILSLNRSLQTDPPVHGYPDPTVMEQVLVALHQGKSLTIVLESPAESGAQVVLPRRIVFTADECWLAVAADGLVDREIRIADIRQATLMEDHLLPQALPSPKADAILPQDQTL